MTTPVRRPTVGLVMIVKNESATLPRLAASLAGQLDHWTLVDTGSTDDTIGTARRVFADVRGGIFEDEWRGFGPSRTVALRAAEGHTDWLLTMDADETVHGRLLPALHAENCDAVEAQLRYFNLHYWVPRLVRSGVGWVWRGRAHEYLVKGQELGRRVRTDAFWVEHHADGGNRSDKLQREESLLLQDWRELPDDPRTAFYLARTYDDLGRDTDALAWYRRRVSLPGWDEETWYARLRLGACLVRRGQLDEGCGVLWHAWGERSWRAEPLAALAECYRSVGLWKLAWEACQLAFAHTPAEPDGDAQVGGTDALFVDVDAASWRIAYEASIAAWYVAETTRGRRLSEFLLGNGVVPEVIREAVRANLHYYRS